MPKKTEELKAEENNTAEVSEKSTENDTVEATEEKSKGSDTETSENSSLVNSVLETVSNVAGAISSGVSAVVDAVTPSSSATDADKSHHSKRAERIGIVQSDKMTKTVTVRVDRQVKHPIYRKYIKRRKNFMAHDELGSGIGDKVRIIETRPLSAKKRWRVIEIIQKAEK